MDELNQNGKGETEKEVKCQYERNSVRTCGTEPTKRRNRKNGQ